MCSKANLPANVDAAVIYRIKYTYIHTQELVGFSTDQLDCFIILFAFITCVNRLSIHSLVHSLSTTATKKLHMTTSSFSFSTRKEIEVQQKNSMNLMIDFEV